MDRREAILMFIFAILYWGLQFGVLQYTVYDIHSGFVMQQKRRKPRALLNVTWLDWYLMAILRPPPPIMELAS